MADQAKPKKQTSLETADQMFKDAFQLKMQQIVEKYPQLTPSQCRQKTAEYFQQLHEKKT